MKSLRELIQYSHLILSFAQRDVRARYKQTVFGVSWAIIQPFSLMVVFTFVFAKFLRVPSDGVPYPIFAYSALIFWTFFATSVFQGTVAMTANASLVRKIYFPRETLLLSVLISAALDLSIAFLILVGLFLYYQVALSLAALWILPLLAIQLIFTLGLICVTSSVHVYLRDIGHGLPFLLQLWMFATPVAYPLTVVPDWLRPLYLLNPMTPIMTGYRQALLHGRSPDFAATGVGLLAAIALLVLAYPVFKHAERTFADVI